MATITVTRKGQVTIPKDVREAMDIQPGSKLVIESSGPGEAILRKLRPREPRPDRFDRALGAAEVKWAGTTDEYMEFIRENDSDASFPSIQLILP